MEANGPRRDPRETCTVPTVYGIKSTAPWLVPLISPEPEELVGELDEENVRVGFVKRDNKQDSVEPLKKSSLGDVFVKMPESPFTEHHGSSDRDMTPRISTAKPARSHLSKSSAQTSKPLRKESEDSAYASAMELEIQDSIVDVDVWAANARARESLEIMRARVLSTRRATSEKRQELQVLRNTLRNATDGLMRVVRRLLAQDDIRDLQSLEPQHQELSAAQDALGPAEYAYDLLESRLSREEEELENEESQFYTRNNIRLAPAPDLNLQKLLTLRESSHVSEDNLLTPKIQTQLERDFLDQWSKAEHIKEELRDLGEEQYELTQELIFRARHSLQLSPEKTARHLHLPKTHDQLLEQLDKIEKDLYESRDLCLKEGLFTEDEYIYESYDALVDDIWESVNDARDRSPLYAQYVPHEVNFADKQDHVNTWLLEWMQESPIEITRLKSFIDSEYPQRFQELDEDDWSGLVLDFWNRDSAGESASMPKHSTIDVLLGETGSSLKIEDWGFGTRSLSPQRDVGIDLRRVDRIPVGQGPVRRRKRALNSRARSL